MAVVGVADQWMVLMAITLLWAILAISYRDNKTLQLLAGISWFISSLGTFAIGDKTSVLTISLSLLFSGFGILFVVKAALGYVEKLEEKKQQWRNEW